MASDGKMLHEFLSANRADILKLTAEKTQKIAGARALSELLKQGLPLFYEQLIKVLEQKLQSNPPEALLATAAAHGKEFLRLGYSLSHVVHAYGAMCQAITELATQRHADITASEFNILNGCLDVAIASAVSEFQFHSVQATEEREVQHLGFLAHELRNALSSATIAQDMIRAGLVGTGGSTAAVLEANLTRMRLLIDRSLSEVRMRADADVFVERFRLSDLLDQIVLTARVDANKRKQTVTCEADWSIEIEADRQFLLSAIANLMHNAIKYSKIGAKIFVRTKTLGDRALIEIEDECGGIQEEKVKAIFKPYVQANNDRSGLGLGLSITQRAIHLSHGKLSVQNKPGFGCTFTVDIPLKLAPGPSQKNTVQGINSVQPDLRRKN